MYVFPKLGRQTTEEVKQVAERDCPKSPDGIHASNTEDKGKMTYLIRRMNRMGQWQNIGSLDYIPLLWFGWENFLRANFGPGRYNIARVERGLAGMQDEGTFNIAYDHQLLQWVPEQPNTEYFQAHNINGDLIVGRLTNVIYFYVPRNNPAVQDRVRAQLNQGVQGFQGGWIIIRINGLPYDCDWGPEGEIR
jgi:hypothetical protein